MAGDVRHPRAKLLGFRKAGGSSSGDMGWRQPSPRPSALVPRDMGLPRDMGQSKDMGRPRDMGLPRDVGLPRDMGLSRDVGLPRDMGLSRDVGPPRDMGLSRDMEDAHFALKMSSVNTRT